MAEQNLVVFMVITGFVMFFIGLAKGGLGGMLGGLATPIMALVMPVDRALGLILPVLMFADIFAVFLHRGKWNMRLILLLLPGAVVGVTLGTYFIMNAPTRALRLALGIIVLLFVLYKLFERRIQGSFTYSARTWHGIFAGTVTGFSSTLAHTGAPPVSIYLLMQKIEPAVFVSTSVLFFFILNWIKVPYYYSAGLFDFDRLLSIVYLTPLIPAGVVFGKWVVDRVNRQVFEKIIIVALAILGVVLLFT